MATLDGKEVPQCSRCKAFRSDATERTVVKKSGDVSRVLCDACTAATTQVYKVKSGRKSAEKDDEGSTAAEASTHQKKAGR